MATPPELDRVTRCSIDKHVHALRQGFHAWPSLTLGLPPAMGDFRWPAELILATWAQAETGRPPTNGLEYRVGRSDGGFDALEFAFLPPERWLPETATIDTSLSLNRRAEGRRIEIPIPWYGAGMSYGSVSEQVMLATAAVALSPSRWPPRPGLAPCAYLSSTIGAHPIVSSRTPNMPVATCVMTWSRYG